MDSFIKKIFDDKSDDECHSYFVRFGKGRYPGRFIINITRGSKIKIRSSFEMANDFVRIANHMKDLKFSGKILTKDKMHGRDGKKKAGSFVYEIENSSIKDFPEAYFYLVDTNTPEISLKIKKALPKPGKGADKVDDKFCSLEIDEKYWPEIKRVLFWDLPEKFKKARVEHEVIINEIVYPKGESDPAKIRELAKRKGTLVRKVLVDGKEYSTNKEFAS